MALALISNQWSTVQTQSALLIQRQQMFDPIGNDDYAQVIHMSSANHWISASNIRGNGHVRLFDSLGLPVPSDIRPAILSKSSCD